jgi:hypothetical protein
MTHPRCSPESTETFEAALPTKSADPDIDRPQEGYTKGKRGRTGKEEGQTGKRGIYQEEGGTPRRRGHTNKRDTLARGRYIHKGRKTEKSKPKARRRHDETTRRYINTTNFHDGPEGREGYQTSSLSIKTHGRKEGRHHGTDNKNDQGENTQGMLTHYVSPANMRVEEAGEL